MVYALSGARFAGPSVQLPPSDQRRVIHLSPLPPSEEEREEAADDEEVPAASDDPKEESIKIEIEEFRAGFTNMESKIHRLPPSLERLPQRYVSPKAVAIGPYHRHSSRVKEMERVKRVATHYFYNGILGSYLKMYDKFCSEMGDVDVRSLYVRGDDAVKGISDGKLMEIMLCDGCFLLQYMLMCTTSREDMPPDHQPLACFFDSNQAVINHDIMLLENQLPWVVIKTLQKFRPEVPVLDFIAKMGRTLQVCRRENEEISFVLDDDSYTPPHLLALLRFYKTGSNITVANEGQDKRFSLINYCCYNNNSGDGSRPMSKTISAMELAENGIKLTASRTMKFIDMGFKKKLFSSELFLAPLLLDEIRACWLLNMAAFELCMGTTSKSNGTENQAVCSYLAVFAMLMDREDDVHKLRSKRLVQGELTNEETLHFFKGLIKRISGGPLYVQIMEEIEDYKLKRWMWIKVHKFVYHNYKTIAAVLSIIGVLVGIFKTLFSLKQH